jgi:hypothetical protein
VTAALRRAVIAHARWRQPRVARTLWADGAHAVRFGGLGARSGLAPIHAISNPDQPTMRLVSTLALLVSASAALAQGSNCFSAPPAGAFLGNSADTVYPGTPIGFAFPFGGATYTDVHVSDHGFVALSNGGVPTPPVSGAFTYTPSLANFSLGSPMIAALWSDTIGGSATPGAGVYVDSSATQCRIEWRSVASFGFPTPEFNLAMTLFPSGQVQFDYGVNVTNNSTFGGVSDNGIVGMFTGGALPASVNLSAGGASANNNTFENFVVASTFDMASNRLLMVPSNPGWSYALLGGGNCASAADFGSGCGGDPADSVYEEFTGATFDLAQKSYRWIRSGSGYVLLQQPVAYMPPTAGASAVAAGQLDSQQAFTLSAPMPIAGGVTTTLNITTKCQVELSGTPVGIDFIPTGAKLLNWPNTAFHCWHDFDQTSLGSGTIKFEEVGGIAYATWDGVHSFSAPQPSTVQWQFEIATGSVSLVVLGTGGINAATVDGSAVGYSVGGNSVAPAPTDLSALAGAVTIGDAPAVLGPLAMTTAGLPSLGNGLFAYTVSDVPALVPLAFQFFGTTPLTPGIDLTVIGMPGCFGYTSSNLATLSGAVIGGTASIPLPIPANSALVGVALTSQAAAFSLSTPLNLITSNGNTATIGF